MKLILLTSEQAGKVRGRHGRYSGLDPVPTDNGMFVLPVEVLADPEHEEVLNDLGACKFAEIDDLQEIDMKLPKDDPARIKQVLSVKSISGVTIKAEQEMTEKPAYEDVVKIITR
jgi:hypothetical protein